MKRLLLVLSFAMATAAHPQDEDPTVAAERTRLTQERERAEVAFRVEEKSCYGKFAVNDCLAAAKAKRREALGDLKRQEIVLNDAERKRKAAERRHDLDEKSVQQRERESAPSARTASQPDRGLRSSERAAPAALRAKAAQREQEVKQRVAGHETAKQRREAEAASNVRARERREIEAKERADRLRKRQAERTKPPASALKDPA